MKHDYITLEDQQERIEDSEVVSEGIIDPTQRTKLFVLGSCEMTRLIDNFTNLCNEITLETTTIKGNHRIVNVGTEYIRSCFDMTMEEKKFCSRYFYNYTSEGVFKTKLFDETFDYVILSFSDDFIYTLNKKKDDNNLRIIRDDEYVFGGNYNILCIDEQDKWLQEHFNNTSFIDEERFYQNLQWIRNKLDSSTILILLTGPEYNFYRLSTLRSERCNPYIRNQIIKLNQVIKRFTDENPNNVGLVDVNKSLKTISDFTDYIFHWTTKKSYEIAKECLILMAQKKAKRKKTT